MLWLWVLAIHLQELRTYVWLPRTSYDNTDMFIRGEKQNKK